MLDQESSAAGTETGRKRITFWQARSNFLSGKKESRQKFRTSSEHWKPEATSKGSCQQKKGVVKWVKTESRAFPIQRQDDAFSRCMAKHLKLCRRPRGNWALFDKFHDGRRCPREEVFMASKLKSRRGLAIFFLVLTVGSAYFEHRILVLGGSIQNHLGLIFGLVWWVAVSSIVARLALREGIGDVSFRWGGAAGTRAIAIAIAMPVIVGFTAYGIAWSTGLAHFKAPAPSRAVLGMHFAFAQGAFARLCQCLGLMSVLGAMSACQYAAGEEIGWRGYMLTRLVDSGVPAPILISGLAWGLWHTPLIFSGQYASGAHPILSACLFMVGIVAGGYVFAWLRLSSGSIWPCIWGHSAWNAVIQGAFDMSTSGRSVWVGESGVLTAGMLVLFALVLYKVWPLAQGSSLPGPVNWKNSIAPAPAEGRI